ncbi:hypothetical protein T08_1048 [Trichinella sp. T8]|nr:hypothetical protein T08_1048 [Trichinella sp. T8]
MLKDFQTVLVAVTELLLVVSVIWLLMGGSADGGCPVSSTWDNYGGKKLDDGGCLTVVDMFEVKKFYGQRQIYAVSANGVSTEAPAATTEGIIDVIVPTLSKCVNQMSTVKMMMSAFCLNQTVYVNVVISFLEVFNNKCNLCIFLTFTEIGSCEKAACQNDATRLQVTNNAYRCDCSYKYGGTLCEKGKFNSSKTKGICKYYSISELTITEIYIRLITNSLAFQVALIIIVLIITVFGFFLLIMAIRVHHIRKETSFERVLRTGLEQRKAVIAQHDAKHKFGNGKGNTQKSSSSAVGQEVHCGKLRIWNKSSVPSSASKAASGKKSKSKKARASLRDASRRRKLKGRKSRSRRSRSQSNSRHRSRSRSESRSRSRSRSNSAS